MIAIHGNSSRAAARFALWLALGSFGPAIAATEATSESSPATAPTSSLWISGGGDSSNTRDASAELDLGFSDSGVFTVGGGATRFTVNGTNFDADSWLVGVSGRPVSPLRTGIRYGFWGDKNQLTIKTLGENIDWDIGDWTLAATFEQRQIAGFTRPIFGRLRIEMDSPGVGAGVAYSPDEAWRIRVSGMSYTYSRDPSVLNTRLAALLFSKRALTLANLVRGLVTAEISRDWQSFGLRLYDTASTSAIDGSRSDSTGLVLALYPSRRFTIELDNGVTTAQNQSDVSYWRANLGMHW